MRFKKQQLTENKAIRLWEKSKIVESRILSINPENRIQISVQKYQSSFQYFFSRD